MLKRQKTFQNEQAKLYLVGVPIGNFDDITLRAINTLAMVDIIFCEDTRVTLKLLKHLNIKKPLKSYHTFNENDITESLIAKIKNGQNVAIVSDAGMPIISDPGYLAVKYAILNDVVVVVVPSASAFTTALVGSGIPSNRIVFTGFLNSTATKRKKELQDLKDVQDTIILYESPHRIKETLTILNEIMPTRYICLARELTKTYEEYLHGTPQEILDVVDEIKGEIVIVIEGATLKEINQDLIALPLEEHMLHYLKQGLDEKDAMRMVAKDRHISKSSIYQALKRK